VTAPSKVAVTFYIRGRLLTGLPWTAGQVAPRARGYSERNCVVARALTEFCFVYYNLYWAAVNPLPCGSQLLFFLAIFTPATFIFIGISPVVKTKFARIHIIFPLAKYLSVYRKKVSLPRGGEDHEEKIEIAKIFLKFFVKFFTILKNFFGFFASSR